MQLHRFYLDALEQVLSWDLPDEACPVAVSTQAGLLAGLDTDGATEADPD